MKYGQIFALVSIGAFKQQQKTIAAIYILKVFKPLNGLIISQALEWQSDNEFKLCK